MRLAVWIFNKYCMNVCWMLHSVCIDHESRCLFCLLLGRFNSHQILALDEKETEMGGNSIHGLLCASDPVVAGGTVVLQQRGDMTTPCIHGDGMVLLRECCA
ncbi:hypothetical protein PVAP13_7NG089600 [Panicum virgatum]|uniref:Uncharacterized protein n=1 Tax=Panicum virgatum TaxID=38727 RepID=A0A8T0PQ91_PANVG|nr:hypothetical protein PVAP13_7NG089600 [Panicum virgatum]